MDYNLKDFHVGQRVQLHPTTGLWKSGHREGEIVRIGRKDLIVRIATLARPVFVCPCNLIPVE
jgi:hypothetical protein